MSAHLLLAEVLALPLEERRAFIEKLRESIEHPDSVNKSIEDAQFAEVERRWQRYESGQDRGSAWEQVHARVFGPEE
jgi:putative addiction module component (TIGR02574 family)